MKNWYNSLTTRERNLVTYGSIIAALILFWLLIARPLYNRHKTLSVNIQAKSAQLELMKAQSAKVKRLQSINSNSSTKTVSGNPQQLVERALQTWRLKPALQRMQSQGPKSVLLSLKNANSDRFMRFLYDLENKYALAIENMAIKVDKETGLVDVRLTVKQ
jgi:type II secretory pathway component PulM